MFDICDNLQSQVRNAFQKYSSENVQFRINLGNAGLTTEDVIPRVKFKSDGRRVWVENTRIRFDLHAYAHLGYAEMAQFVEACWKTPDLVVNEFLLSGLLPHPSLFGYGKYTVNLPRQWNDAENWGNGEITLDGIRCSNSAENTGLRFVQCAYLAKSLFSKSEDEIWIPPGHYEVSDLAIDIDHEDDDYENCWIGHHHAYATGVVRVAAERMLIVGEQQ